MIEIIKYYKFNEIFWMKLQFILKLKVVLKSRFRSGWCFKKKARKKIFWWQSYQNFSLLNSLNTPDRWLSGDREVETEDPSLCVWVRHWNYNFRHRNLLLATFRRKRWKICADGHYLLGPLDLSNPLVNMLTLQCGWLITSVPSNLTK